MKGRLYRIGFSANDLKSVPEAQAAFMVSSCIAINDITTFLRLFLMALNGRRFQDEKIDDVVSEFALTQALVIQRTLSGKLKEYLHMCRQYQDGCKRRNDEALKPFLDKSKIVCAELKAMPGYELAEWYRDKVTHHYVVNEISGLLKYLQEGAEYNLYLHEKDGNSGYLLGERVLLHKLGDEPGKDDFERLDEYQDWVIYAARVVQTMHHDYCIQFLETFFPKKVAHEFIVEIPENLLGQIENTKAPLFWDFRDTSPTENKD